MFKNVREFYQASGELIDLFNEFISQYDLGDLVKADHICYKCSSSESFEEMKKMFERERNFETDPRVKNWIYQSFIAGRRIALIKTLDKVSTLAGDISLVELSDQKPDGNQKDGFHHVEIYPSKIGVYAGLILAFKQHKLKITREKRPHHTTDDIKLEEFIIRLSRESLLDKIREEIG